VTTRSMGRICSRYWSSGVDLGAEGAGRIDLAQRKEPHTANAATDFGTAPLRAGAIVRVYQPGTQNGDRWDFTVLGVQPV